MSESDSTRIVVQVYQCRPAITEFGLRILYSTDGHDRELIVGSKDSPYRVLSGTAANYFVNGRSTPRPTETADLDSWRPALCK